jgi:hypothetical protein
MLREEVDHNEDHSEEGEDDAAPEEVAEGTAALHQLICSHCRQQHLI